MSTLRDKEDRQSAYEHFLELGVPDILAASMAEQAKNPKRTHKDVKWALLDFADWVNTIEGNEFWMQLFDEVEYLSR